MQGEGEYHASREAEADYIAEQEAETQTPEERFKLEVLGLPLEEDATIEAEAELQAKEEIQMEEETGGMKRMMETYWIEKASSDKNWSEEVTLANYEEIEEGLKIPILVEVVKVDDVLKELRTIEGGYLKSRPDFTMAAIEALIKEIETQEEIQMEETKEETGYERELKELKISRENDIEYRKVLKGLQERFEEKHKDMLTSMKENQEAIVKLEESIKTKALAEYDADESKNKKLSFGVGIRVMKDVLFDDDLAKEWAKKTGLCLKLDVSGFKKIAKAQDIDFVTIEERASATIPSEIKIE